MACGQSQFFPTTFSTSRPTRSQEMSQRERQLVWLMFERRKMARQNVKPDYFWVEESDLTGKDNAFRAWKKDHKLVTYRSLSSEDIYTKAKGQDDTESVDVDSQCSSGDDESELLACLDQGLIDAISSPDGMGSASTPGCQVSRELIPRTSASPLGWLPCYATYPEWLLPDIRRLLERESDTETSSQDSSTPSADFSTVFSSASTVPIPKLLDPTVQTFVPGSPYESRSGSCQEAESSLSSWSEADGTCSSKIKRLSSFSRNRDKRRSRSNSSALSRSFWYNHEEASGHSCCFGIPSNPCWLCSGSDKHSERAVKKETTAQNHPTLKQKRDLIKNVGQDSEGEALPLTKERKLASMHVSARNLGCNRQLAAPSAIWSFLRSILLRRSLFLFALIAISVFSELVAGQNNNMVAQTVHPEHTKTKATFQERHYITNDDFRPNQKPALTSPALNRVATLNNSTPNPQHANNIFRERHEAFVCLASDPVTPTNTVHFMRTWDGPALDLQERIDRQKREDLHKRIDEFPWLIVGLFIGTCIGILRRIYAALRTRFNSPIMALCCLVLGLVVGAPIWFGSLMLLVCFAFMLFLWGCLTAQYHYFVLNQQPRRRNLGPGWLG